MTNSTFDLLGHLAGRGYPEDSIKIYLDENAMYHYANLEKLISVEKDSEKAAELEKVQEQYLKEMEETSLTFHLRGIPQEVKDAISTQAQLPENEGDVEFTDTAALEAHIVKVENASGATAEKFDYDTVNALLKTMPISERSKLMDLVIDLSYDAITYERGDINPDF